MLRIGSRRMKSGLEKLLSSADSTQKEKLWNFTSFLKYWKIYLSVGIRRRHTVDGKHRLCLLSASLFKIQNYTEKISFVISLIV